jgi:hypothetical protein
MLTPSRDKYISHNLIIAVMMVVVVVVLVVVKFGYVQF